MPLRIRFRIEDGSGLGQRIVLSLDGELDLHTVHQLVDRLARIGDDDQIWLDLNQLRFIDSSGIAAISSSKSRFGPRLRITGAQPPIMHVFESAGAARLLADA